MAKSANTRASPTAASEAAPAMIAIEKTAPPTSLYCAPKATKLRIDAFSINSIPRRILTAERCAARQKSPSAKRIAPTVSG
ncbi:MAG: hypothetical protein AAB229_07245 [Candidatus Hydrogenedentota bacterium]